MSCGNKSTYDVISGQPNYESKKSDNIFRIGAWVAPPPANWNGKGNANFITQERYNEIAESGINVIYALYENGDIASTKKACEYAKNAGIEYLARDTRLDVDPKAMELEQGELHAMTSSYDGEDALKGWLVTDEPDASKFDRLGRLKKFYDKEYPNKEFYVNLFPTYATTAQLGVDSYADYIQQYIDKVKPEFLSYDHYTMMEDGYGKKSLTDDVLYNLEVVANKCKAAGIPMYTFVQAMSYDNNTRIPNQAEIRHQVFTQLAYGSRSIQYFCYFTPLEFGGVGSPSMITVDGEKTDIYTHVQTVNKELANLDEAFLDFNWVGTMTIQGSEVSESRQILMCEESLEKVDALSDINVTKNTLVGVFKNEEGRDGFIISNFTDPGYTSTQSGYTNDGEISIRFNGADSLLVYHGNKKEVVSFTNETYKTTLEAGDGMFVIPFKK